MAKQQNPDYVPKIPRSPHDLSQEFIFTTPCGPLLPIFYDRALPGDKYSLQSNIFIRTNPLLTAAMADLEFYVDWFFVPATMIYTPFQSLAWQTQDLLSSNYPQNLALPLARPSYEFGHYDSVDSLDGVVSFPSINAGDLDTVLGFESIGKSAYRLLMHLGLNPQCITDGLDGEGLYLGSFQPDFFPWQLLSYHTIYYKHYRNEDFETDAVTLRNWDKFAGQTVTDELHESFYMCHYAPRKRDYFLSVFPSPLVNSKSLLSSTLATPQNYLSRTFTPTKFTDDNNGANDLSDTAQVGSVANSALTTAKLRSMFAFEKLLRIVGRAEKNYDSQVLAHFGYKVPHDYLHNLTFIGSQNGRVHIGEVISTAGVSGGSELGEIAGKGYGKMNARELKFTAPCHGTLMAIFYIKPVTYYYGGIDRLNWFASINDVYQPEYDKLGKQPLYAMECFVQPMPTTQEFRNARLGWQWRYQERKRKVNRVSIAFAKPDDLFGPGPSAVTNPWSAWVLTRRPFAEWTQGVKARDFMVCPSDTDQIMSMPFNPLIGDENVLGKSPWQMFQYDPFIVNSSMNVSKVSVMSKFGEPDIDSI